MTKTEYRSYIASAEWQQRRKAYLKDKFECNRCGMPRYLAAAVYDQDLHVHHVSYQSLGEESDSDLEPLCRRCHEIETFGSSGLRELPSRKCSTCSWVHWNPYSEMCDRCIDAARRGITIPHGLLFKTVKDTEMLPYPTTVWKAAIGEISLLVTIDAIIEHLAAKEQPLRTLRAMLEERWRKQESAA